MQAWELERELGKAQDKLKAIKDLVTQYFDTPAEDSLLTDTAYVVLGKIKELLEEYSSEGSQT